MKKVLAVLAVAVLTAGFVQAQITFGARGGINFSNMKYDYGGLSMSPKMKPGIQLGVVAEYALSESLFLQPGFLFAQQGMKMDDDDETIKLTLNYIQIPVNFQFKTEVGGGTILLLQAGPYGGIGVNGKWKYGKDSEDVEFGSGENADFKTFDFGLGLGAGIEFGGNMQLGIGYNLGLANLDTSGSSKFSAKNNGLAFTFTYFFK